MQSETIHITHETIVTPGFLPDNPKDGLGMSRKNTHFVIRDVTVDLENYSLDDIDEAASVTYGSSAFIANSVFENAGKLFLCGSGDSHKIDDETGKTVIFTRCIFRNFSRRAVEAKSGMKIVMYNCIIENWGEPTRFIDKSFAAKASNGASIKLVNCTFIQKSFWKGWKQMLKDFANNFWQSLKEEPFLGLFRLRTWLPGVCQGLVKGKDGSVIAFNCKKNKWWIYIENHYAVHETECYDPFYMNRICM